MAEICVSVGWTGVGSFTTTFTRVYGMPPTAYRARFPAPETYAMVPSCILKFFGRPKNKSFREDTAGPPP
ncbi:hypothetical protein Afil01_68900 [Actinorhabdospora filicis]|uniref:HTH araC/xylS-type domain-containing protein n=1 Tax=Actinorhabdospora filicis TaxID=1785913 RepID=A0A9W6STK4_9ACTN|nr:hypothetical protein Afil01_68900 [Actinorhabdospora filicis]